MPFSAARARTKAAVRFDGQDLVPVLVLHADRQSVARYAGIIDQDVQRAEGRFGLGTEFGDLSPVGEIAGQDVGALAELRRQTLERVAARSRNADVCALSGEARGRSRPDAAGRAGDQSRLAGQIEHGSSQDAAGLAANRATSSGEPTGTASTRRGRFA